MMKLWNIQQYVILGLIAIMCSGTTHAVADSDIPGSDDAIEIAVELAAWDVAHKLISLLPSDVKTIALFPLYNDSTSAANATFEMAMTDVFANAGKKLVTRSDSEWYRLTGEWEFTEDNIDVMPVLPNFQNVYPAGAMAWGRLRYAEIDEGGVKAKARIEVKIGMPDSGEVISAIGNGLQSIDFETATTGIVMSIVRKPWFLFAVIIGVVAAIAFIIIIVPLKRKMALAAKPREITRRD